MDFLSIIQTIGVIGMIVCWIAGIVLVAKIQGKKGEGFRWYWLFTWWVSYYEMRQAPGPKPSDFPALNIAFIAFLVFGVVPNILRIFI